MFSHANYPVADYLGSDLFKIFFSCRNKTNVSSIGFVIININQPQNILDISQKPVLSPGKIGLFDDSGVSIGSLISIGNRKYMYYFGWNLCLTIPWRNSIGLAVQEEGEKFQKFSRVPILDRSEIDPFSIGYPWVIKDNDIFKMWYCSNLSCQVDSSTLQYTYEYTVKYAESLDGIHWKRKDKIVLPLSPNECAISRPCVIKQGNLFKMWYSYKKKAYKIGYAESNNGIDWIRLDRKVGIEPSESGWDAEMIAYPSIFEYSQQPYMLYNGKDFGAAGFGIAILD